MLSYSKLAVERATDFITSYIWEHIKENNIKIPNYYIISNGYFPQLINNSTVTEITGLEIDGFLTIDKNNVKINIHYKTKITLDCTYPLNLSMYANIEAYRVIGKENDVVFYDSFAGDNYAGYLKLIEYIYNHECDLKQLITWQ